MTTRTAPPPVLMRASASHVCQCAGCDPGIVPAGAREVEGHTALRLGDRDRDPARWRSTRAWLDRDEVTEFAFEARPGHHPVGYVGVFMPDLDGAKHVCRTCLLAGNRSGADVCTAYLHGDVAIAVAGSHQ